MNKKIRRISLYIRKFPLIKKVFKRIYQIFFYVFSKKKYDDEILNPIFPNDGSDYFLGYYDKSPIDSNSKFILALNSRKITSAAPSFDAKLIMKNKKNNKIQIIDESVKSWNSQQGNRAHWLGPDHNRNIIYNNYISNRYVSVIYDIQTKEKKIINHPIYDVDSNGEIGYGLDFNRLNYFRKGYGYSNQKFSSPKIGISDDLCIYSVNLKTGEYKEVIKYKELINIKFNEKFDKSFHWVNHISLNKENSQMIFLHRYKEKNTNIKSRLMKYDIIKKSLSLIIESEIISHFNWINENTIIMYCSIKKEEGYYIYDIGNNSYKRIIKSLDVDGHPSSINNDLFVSDTYPNKSRVISLMLFNKNEILKKINLFSPFNYDNDIRCDLHPKLSFDKKIIFIDSSHSGRKNMYSIGVNDL